LANASIFVARLTFTAGDALHENARCLVDQNCHSARASNQFAQSWNIEFQIEAFDSGKATFDIACEKLGIFGGEFFAG
jgi:hypothetical protein